MREEIVKTDELSSDFKTDGLKENLDLIKTTIDKSKYSFKHLFTLLLFFGFVSLIFYSLRFLNIYLKSENLGVFAGTGFSVAALLLFIPYKKNYRMVKSARGEYTQSLYQIWGYALFIPHAVNLSRILFSYNHNIILYYDMYISFLSLGFLLMAILISGILIKNKLLIIFGVASPIFVASYLILRMSLGVSFKLNGFEYHIKYIIKQTTLLMIIFTALYFAFAVYYKLKGEFFSNEEEN